MFNKEKLTKNYGAIVMIGLVGTLISSILNFFMAGTSSSNHPFIYLLLTLASFVVTFFFAVFIETVAIHAYRNDDAITMENFKAAFEHVNWGTALKINFIASFLIAIGLILFVIPGIYLSLAFSFIGFLLYDEKGHSNLIKRSMELTDGYKLKILLGGIVISILTGAVSSIFGLFIKEPALVRTLASLVTLLAQPIYINYILDVYIEAYDRPVVE
ncbi:MAG: hypothetical protein RR565_05970 [Erysipelothrix sp.]